MINRLAIAASAVLVLTPFSTMAQQAERTVETTSTTTPVEHHDFP